MASTNSYGVLADPDPTGSQSSSSNDEEIKDTNTARAQRNFLVFIVGPKAAGKTETCKKLKERIKHASVVSVDKELADVARSTSTSVYCSLKLSEKTEIKDHTEKATPITTDTMLNVAREAIFPYAKAKPNCVVSGFPRELEQWKKFKKWYCKQDVGEKRLGGLTPALVQSHREWRAAKDDLVKAMRESIKDVVHIEQNMNTGWEGKVAEEVIEKLEKFESWRRLVNQG